MKNKIIFSIDIGDIQNIAMQEIDRQLTKEEIIKVQEKINQNINWYDPIADSINELLIISNEE